MYEKVKDRDEGEDLERYQPTRGSGRLIDYQYAILDNIIRITKSRGFDIYNNIEQYNIYEGYVDNLERLISPYIDAQYTYDKRILEEIIREEGVADMMGRIALVGDRYNMTLRLAKRKALIPSDDVQTESWLITRQLINDVKDDLDASVLIDGPKGIGKSTVAIALSMEIAREFKYPFSLKNNLYKNSNLLRDYIIDNNPPKGTPFIYDDAGADRGLSKRRAQTLDSIEFNEILQTCRDLGLIIFYTTPADTLITEPSLALFTHRITPILKIKEERATLVKFKLAERHEKEIRWIFLKTPTGERITTVRINIPSQNILDEYKIFRHELSLDKFKTQARRKEEIKKENNPEEIYNKFLPIIRENIKDYTYTWGGKIKINAEDITIKNPISRRIAGLIKRTLEGELNASKT